MHFQDNSLPEQHFLIVGAGIAGLTSAYMLLEVGHKVRQRLNSSMQQRA